MVKINGWAAVITIWIVVTLMRVEGATSSNSKSTGQITIHVCMHSCWTQWWVWGWPGI